MRKSDLVRLSAKAYDIPIVILPLPQPEIAKIEISLSPPLQNGAPIFLGLSEPLPSMLVLIGPNQKSKIS